jgi:hypothetical protein
MEMEIEIKLQIKGVKDELLELVEKIKKMELKNINIKKDIEIKLFEEFEDKKIKYKNQTAINLMKRLKFIFSVYKDNKINIGAFYKVCRRRGYHNCYKTFFRDIQQLKLLGYIDCEEIRKPGHITTLLKGKKKIYWEDLEEQK